MYIFFDSKVTSLFPHPEIVSIGLVSDTGCKFYAEVDIPTNKIDSSIRPIVESGLEYKSTGTFIGECTYEKSGDDGNDITMKGVPCDIVAMLRKWLNQFEDSLITVCDTPASKWVAFLSMINGDGEILKKMGVKPVDISSLFMLAGYVTTTNRLKYLGENHPLTYNALDDAEIIMNCFEKLISEIDGNTPDTWKQCDKCGRLCTTVECIDDYNCCTMCKQLTMDEMLR